MDRRPRRRSRPHPELVGEIRISLRQSVRNAVHADQRAERLSFQRGSTGRELQVLNRPALLQSRAIRVSRGLAPPAGNRVISSAGAAVYDDTTRLTAFGPLPFLSG